MLDNSSLHISKLCPITYGLHCLPKLIIEHVQYFMLSLCSKHNSTVFIFHHPYYDM